MSESGEPTATFNLWSEPWITLERPDRGTEQLGIEQTLLRAHEHLAIYEPSPLVVVGIHRLLTAILQAAIGPRRPADLQAIWQAGCFPAVAVQSFGGQYAGRFDLFSPDAPFLQSADLPLRPGKGDKVKVVAYLATESPAGTAITHYHHGAEDGKAFCPICAAGCLTTIPPFATSGGAGIKPSINGVPPIYVLPGGQSLFESLAASLLLPEYQPEVADRQNDTPWWKRPSFVGKGQEVYQVGYLHSLTFPARRVRLHPERRQERCTRCGQPSAWVVRTMVFDMGESRPKSAPFWPDPFAAYHKPSKGDKRPTPIRPRERHALWREFAGLFLQGNERTTRPRVLDQLGDKEMGTPWQADRFRCVGLRTDMKAKVFEWIDADLQVPHALLSDEHADLLVDQAIEFATSCAGTISYTFRETFGGKSRKQERYRDLRKRMEDDYWAALSDPFRQFILGLVGAGFERREADLVGWIKAVIRQAQEAFRQAAELTGDDGASLRQRAQGERICGILLGHLRNKAVVSNKEESNG